MKTGATSIDPFVHGAASPPKPSGAPSFIVSKMILGPSKTGSPINFFATVTTKSLTVEFVNKSNRERVKKRKKLDERLNLNTTFTVISKKTLVSKKIEIKSIPSINNNQEQRE